MKKLNQITTSLTRCYLDIRPTINKRHCGHGPFLAWRMRNKPSHRKGSLRLLDSLKPAVTLTAWDEKLTALGRKVPGKAPKTEKSGYGVRGKR